MRIPLSGLDVLLDNGLYLFLLLILHSFSTFLHFYTPTHLHRILLMSFLVTFLLLMSLSPGWEHLHLMFTSLSVWLCVWKDILWGAIISVLFYSNGNFGHFKIPSKDQSLLNGHPMAEELVSTS